MNLLLAFAVVVCAAPPPASNPKEADALFKQARALSKEGNSAQACPLLEKSHALDPALGTLLNLGDCYETTGRLVEAFLSFNEAAAWATRNHEASRAELARARAGTLKGRLSWLALSTPTPTPGLTISVNDFNIELGIAAQSVPVDSGTVRITASAPDRERWITSVTVSARQTLAVTVPALALVPELKRPSDMKEFEASLAPVPMVESEVAVPLVRVNRSAPTPNRIPAIGLMSAGAAVAATGLAGLVWSFNTHDRFQRQQTVGFGAPTVTRGEFETLRWVYPASWVATAVGAAAVAAGTAWYLNGPRAWFALVPTPNGLGLTARGSF